jgi:HAD superfamily hydrolase (TIGR01549 family)
MWRQVEFGELSPNDLKVRRFERLAAESQLAFDHERVAEDYIVGLGRFGDLYPGALELVEDLSGPFSLTMITNGIGAVQRGRIERLGIARFFEATVISGEVGVSKPSREIFDIAFDTLGGPDRASCVMIGDGLGSDVLGGINAGVHTCWFNPDRKPNNTTTRPGAEVADYRELRSFVAPAAG